MSFKIDVLSGQPSEIEMAALSAALWVLQATDTAPDQAPPVSAWQRSGLLNTTALGGWPLDGSTWECSERLAQPWQS